MITAFRRYLETWYARAFFMIMVGSFIFWGVGDVVRMIGTTTWVVKAGDQTIEGPAFQAEFQRALSAASRALPQGQEATAELRRKVGDETMQRMTEQAAIAQTLRAMRITAPDQAVVEFARSMPAFHGADGKFSKPLFDAILRNNGMTEARFLDSLRGDLAQRQLLTAVTAGATAPEALLVPLHAAEFEKRSADMVEFPISAIPEPAEPDEAVVRRWYDNHPDLYETPEYRRIKAIELSPRTLAGEITVSDEDLRTTFERYRANYVPEAKRSIEIISAPDETKAASLAEKWRGGLDWAAMKAAADADGASALEMDGATQTQVPDPDLAKAVFALPVGDVSAPIKGGLGWFVVKVTNATGEGAVTLDSVKDKVRERVLAEKAAELMYDRANKIDNLLAAGTALDDLPGDMGIAGVAGTLDASGMTPEGEKAPIPGAPELAAAIAAAAFQTQKGDPPRLMEVPTPSSGGTAYFALVVEDITPAGVKPFDAVRQQAADAWAFDVQRQTQEQAAAAMLKAVTGGQSFSDAATVAGVTPHLTPLVGRTERVEGMPPELQRVLFALKPNEATMLETPEGFIVAIPAEIAPADPKSDPMGFEQTRAVVTRSISGDIGAVFTEALRLRANPKINQKNFDQIVQP